MNKSKYKIIPYRPEFEPALMELERKAPQGTWVRLELIKETFLTRSTVFDQFAAFLCVDQSEQLIAVYSAAIVELKVNGKLFRAGIPFDARVDPAYRKQGIAKKMLLHVRDHFFIPNGVTEFFTILKSSNTAVLKVGQIMQKKIYKYPFVYLTIPTYQRAYLKAGVEKDQQFFVRFFGDKERLSNYYHWLKTGLGIWKTYKMYQVKLDKIAGIIRLGIRLANFFRPARKRLPVQGDVISYGLLFDLQPDSFSGLNQILASLEEKGINHLSVCCRKNDWVYKQLKPLAINTYPYLLICSIPGNPDDNIEIDVRCL